MNDSIAPVAVRATSLHQLIGTGRTQAWKITKEPDFPRPIVLGGRARGYIVDEVKAWLIAKARRA